MTFAIINIVAGVIVASFVAYLLGAYGHRFNWLERGGASLFGSAMILTIGPLLTHGVTGGVSPYDDWSATLLRVGLAMFLVGVVGRLEGYAPAARLSPMPPDWQDFVARLGDLPDVKWEKADDRRPNH